LRSPDQSVGAGDGGSGASGYRGIDGLLASHGLLAPCNRWEENHESSCSGNGTHQ
jgi:hypothetical protein